ncbi:MAG: ATP-binding protein [Pseudobacter sp.]|uniref:HAMP domain-containing sensor histidine kinase n=1 Tax=Pseudobacter sp. TaxID=2045420 RepID=UPI003F818149
MTSTRKKMQGNMLFWKIAAIFTTVLIVLGIGFAMVVPQLSKSYYTAAHQELYGDIAKHLASFTQPIRNGKPDTSVTHDIIHSTMVANPSVEVYLLDTSGNITDFVVPDTTVQLRKVNIENVKNWLAVKAGERPMGDNPKLPGEPSIFSAAPIYENGSLAGYMYTVLASEKQREILSTLNTHLYSRLLLYILLVALAVAAIVGILTYFLITTSIRKVAGVVKRFKEGDYSARIEEQGKGNLGMLSATFNEMADVIVDNFDKIMATDKFRQELIANVSHDLRTPLSIMQGYVETLMMKRDELQYQDRNKYLQIIHDNSAKLSRLVEELFQHAKLEANLVMPQKEPFLINELVSDILVSYQLKAKQRNIHLQLDAPGNLPSVFADLALTERVFQNLLDNAFTFTPDGGSIIVKLSVEHAGIRVQVIDTGKGIAPEDQPYVFERYKQIDNMAATSKGMGIGLAIVKKILELHQIRIEVNSNLGRGTAFYFVMPVTIRPV